MTYKEFLESKIELATDSGFIVEQEHINKALKINPNNERIMQNKKFFE